MIRLQSGMNIEINEIALNILDSLEHIKEKASYDLKTYLGLKKWFSTVKIYWNFSLPLPKPSSNNYHWNELDKKRYELRSKKLKEIVAKCELLPNMELRQVIEELETFVSILEKLEQEVSI